MNIDLAGGEGACDASQTPAAQAYPSSQPFPRKGGGAIRAFKLLPLDGGGVGVGVRRRRCQRAGEVHR